MTRGCALRVVTLLLCLDPLPAAVAELRFTAMPSSTLDLVMTSGAMPSRHILEVDGGGVALFDFDRDGDLDIFLASGAGVERPEHGPGSRLFANRGNWVFEDVTREVGINLTRWAMGVAVGDVDGDGWDDLYITCFGPNVLLRNIEGRSFEDWSTRAGVATPGWSTSAAFADLDGDLDLDLVVVNYLSFDPTAPPGRAGKAYRGVPVMPGPVGLAPEPDRLYENLGDGRFRDASRTAGLRSNGADYGLALRIFDADGDGRPDVFVGNDSGDDQLYRNLGGMRFEEVGAMVGIATNGRGLPQATMGTGLADVDGNGRIDVFVTAFSDDTNTLHLSQPDGFYEDRTAAFGLAAPSRSLLGWGTGFYDFDLDGDEDLFIANGHVYPEMDLPQVGDRWAQPVLLFERDGSRFRAVCAEAWCTQAIHGRATAFGDLDGDLDVDVVVTTLNGRPLLLRNDTPAGRALVVRLSAPPPNRHGYGSEVEVLSAAGTQRRWITGGGSFQSVDAPEAVFGLASPTEPVTIRVRWPDGTEQRLENVSPNRAVVIDKQAPHTPNSLPAPATPNP
jgi:hypothetical protein